MQTNGFALRRKDGVPYYACAALENHPAIRHGFSTRNGGVSLPPAENLNLGMVPWDNPEHVAENRRRFLAAVGIRSEFLVTVAQTHSSDFHIINGRADQWNPRTVGDALITSEKHVAVAVKTADCFPVLISDPRTGVTAAIHAGWRGTLGGILPRTLAAMDLHLQVRAADLIVAIGPGIRSCCFEVGPDVAAAFQSAFAGIELSTRHARRAGKFMVDLPHVLRHQLAEAGVPAANIFDLGLCTCCRPEEFFSHRAQGERAGRLLAVICRCD
jgi:polyphenol oxidase